MCDFGVCVGGPCDRVFVWRAPFGGLCVCVMDGVVCCLVWKWMCCGWWFCKFFCIGCGVGWCWGVFVLEWCVCAVDMTSMPRP